MRILLGITGSIAAIKVLDLYRELSKLGEVKTVLTPSAIKIIEAHFKCPIGEFLPRRSYYTNEGESWSWNDITHINLRDWAQTLVIAPLSMNTLAKLSNGLSDNLLTDIVRAWDKNKPILIAPAANTKMWESSITDAQITQLEKHYPVHLIKPVIGKLACGDVGPGKMETPEKIANFTRIVNKPFRPISSIPYIPKDGHPGSFGYRRSYYFHPGVDLYTKDFEPVFACEDGKIIHIGKFTGPPEHPHWLNTWAMVVKGANIINYGELCDPTMYFKELRPGKSVKKGDIIGRVKQVIPDGKERPDIPGHSKSMLHFEMYSYWPGDFADWKGEKPDYLLDPTEYLERAYE